MAREAADRFQLDRVLFIPAAHPPHKSGGTHASYEDRVHMAELACAVDPRFEVSRLEAGERRSYSIDTIEKLRARIGAGDELYFLIGADAFSELRSWRRWEDVARAVRFIVVGRPGYRYDAPPGVQLDRLDGLNLSISSSAIRQALAAGEQPHSVPAPVLSYILQHSLYASQVPAPDRQDKRA